LSPAQALERPHRTTIPGAYYKEREIWSADGHLHCIHTAVIPAEFRAKLTAAKLELPLRFLKYRRLFKYRKRSDAAFSLTVRFAGADRAIRFCTWFGRLDLRYRQHRGAILGIGTTVFVSF